MSDGREERDEQRARLEQERGGREEARARLGAQGVQFG